MLQTKKKHVRIDVHTGAFPQWEKSEGRLWCDILRETHIHNIHLNRESRTITFSVALHPGGCVYGVPEQTIPGHLQANHASHAGT